MGFLFNHETFLKNSPIYMKSNKFYNIVDKNNIALLLAYEDENGNRYSSDSLIRESTVHIVGDPAGNIKTAVNTIERKTTVSNYSLFNGMFFDTRDNEEFKLTIDSELSKKVAMTLEPYDKVVCLISDYTTGEILTCISKPFFDPQEIPSDIDINSDYEGAFINKAFEGTFVPGSIFKLVTLAVFLEEDKSNYIYHCKGMSSFFSNDRSSSTTIVCEDSIAHGEVNLQKMLAVSCNCGFANIGVTMGEKTLSKYIGRFKVCDSIKINDIETKKGNYKLANDVNLAWSSVGQGEDLITPASFMLFLNAIANNGISQDLSYLADTSKNEKRILSSDTSEKIQDMMKYNVTYNYSKNYNYPNNTCAKSGTAQVNASEAPHSWFVGFLDDEERPYSFVILIEHGGSGSKVAGEVASKILNEL